jgi:RuvB-like protein 1 (pontin 52)
LDVANARP